MTSKWALTTAVFINYVLGISVFIAPQTNQLSYIGPMPGLIILISLALLFSEIELIPARFKTGHKWIFFILELIMSLLVLEFFIVKVWTKIEGFMFSIVQFLLGRGNLYAEMGGNGFMTLLISGISLCFFCYAIIATNSTEAIITSIAEIYNTIESLYVKIKEISSKQKICETSMNAQACNLEPQVLKCEQPQVYRCVPVCTPVSQPYIRNPHCPLHGDQEINHHHHVASTPVRTNRRNVS